MKHNAEKFKWVILCWSQYKHNVDKHDTLQTLPATTYFSVMHLHCDHCVLNMAVVNYSWHFLNQLILIPLNGNLFSLTLITLVTTRAQTQKNTCLQGGRQASRVSHTCSHTHADPHTHRCCILKSTIMACRVFFLSVVNTTSLRLWMNAHTLFFSQKECQTKWCTHALKVLCDGFRVSSAPIRHNINSELVGLQTVSLTVSQHHVTCTDL